MYFGIDLTKRCDDAAQGQRGSFRQSIGKQDGPQCLANTCANPKGRDLFRAVLSRTGGVDKLPNRESGLEPEDETPDAEGIPLWSHRCRVFLRNDLVGLGLGGVEAKRHRRVEHESPRVEDRPRRLNSLLEQHRGVARGEDDDGERDLVALHSPVA